MRGGSSGGSFTVGTDGTTQAADVSGHRGGFTQAARREIFGDSRHFRSAEESGSAGFEAGACADMVAAWGSAHHDRADPPQAPWGVEAIRGREGGKK